MSHRALSNGVVLLSYTFPRFPLARLQVLEQLRTGYVIKCVQLLFQGWNRWTLRWLRWPVNLRLRGHQLTCNLRRRCLFSEWKLRSKAKVSDRRRPPLKPDLECFMLWRVWKNLGDRLKMLLSFCGQLKSRKTPLNLCVRVLCISPFFKFGDLPRCVYNSPFSLYTCRL